jgi:hypothetical protein
MEMLAKVIKIYRWRMIINLILVGIVILLLSDSLILKHYLILDISCLVGLYGLYLGLEYGVWQKNPLLKKFSEEDIDLVRDFLKQSTEWNHTFYRFLEDYKTLETKTGDEKQEFLMLLLLDTEYTKKLKDYAKIIQLCRELGIK